MRGGLLFATIVIVIVATQPASGQDESAISAAIKIEKALVNAIGEAEKSVVGITRVRKGNRGDPTKPDFAPNEYAAGVVLDKKGSILTAYHVLGNPDENDYYVWVNRTAHKVAKVEKVSVVKGGDPWMDLAVIKISGTPVGLQPIKLSDADRYRKGQLVISLGDPYAIVRDGQVGASWGMISNLMRRAALNPRNEKEPLGAPTLHHYGNLIQTDARLNYHTSGGPVINLEGEMIGLTTTLAGMARFKRSAGYAIPVDDTFRKTVERLKAGEKAEFGFLGIRPEDFLASENRRGVKIFEVVDGTPAAQAQLVEGHAITHINGKAIDSANDLMRELGRLPVASKVDLTVENSKRDQFLIEVTLSKKYVFSSRPAYSEKKQKIWRGMRVDYSTAIANYYDAARFADPQGCVAVAEVEPGSQAWQANVRPSDFISHVGNVRVTTPKQFYAQVVGKTGNVKVRLTASRGGGKVDLQIQP